MLDIKFKLSPGHSSERVWMAPSPLKALFWNTTYSCNFKCDICFTNSGHPSPEELTTREAKDMLTTAYDAGVDDIIISGGEPFIRDDLPDILEYMGTLGLKARIASNGSLLDDDILKRLKDTTLTKSFQISIDTLDPDLYGKLHGVSPGMLSQVLRTLRLIKKHGFHTTVSTRLTPQTLDAVPALLDRAVDEGWATVTVHFPILSGRCGNNYPQDIDFLTLLIPSFNYFLTLPRHWLIEMYIPWAQYHPAMQNLEKQAKVNYVGCRAGRDRLCVNPCGDISFCVCLDIPEFYLGNVRSDNIADIFSNSKICHMMRDPGRYNICNNCVKLSVCGGGCRAAAYALTNKIDGPDRSCPVIKAS